MKLASIKSLLSALSIASTKVRGGRWVESSCPLAKWRHLGGVDSHPSFGIKIEDTKLSICKCWSCGFGGDVMDLLMEIKRLSKKSPNPAFNLQLAAQIAAFESDDIDFNPASIPEYGEKTPPKDPFIPEPWLSTFPIFGIFPDAVAYLKSRSISVGMASYLDVRFDPIKRRICFPFRNFKGHLMGVQGRAIDEDNPLRYYQYGHEGHRYMYGWMGEDKLNLGNPLVLVEGPIDYTSVLRVYPNVAASFTSGLSVEKIMRIADADMVITFYDHGAGGNSAREKIREVLKNTPVQHLIPTKEEGDAGNLSEDRIREYLSDVVQLQPFNCMTTSSP